MQVFKKRHIGTGTRQAQVGKGKLPDFASGAFAKMSAIKLAPNVVQIASNQAADICPVMMIEGTIQKMLIAGCFLKRCLYSSIAAPCHSVN